MTDLDALLQEIDALSNEDIERVVQHIAEKQRRLAYWIIPGESLKEIQEIMKPIRADIEASGITEEEIDAVIDEAIEEVRRERRA